MLPALLLVLAALSAGACIPPFAETAARRAERQRVRRETYARDSAAYVPALAKYLRDSVVIDSLSRLVNTDSLYRLNRAMLHARDPLPLFQAAECEEFRLHRRHGLAVFFIAKARMLDTLWRREDEGAYRAMQARFPRTFFTGVGTRLCGPTRGGPDSVSGTSLSWPTRRPIAPRPPSR